MVEIARAVSYEAQILIMDEPTSTLSEREVEQLFGIVADLKARGSAIIYITHKIDEVFRIADEVTVMRDGRVVGVDAREPARSRSAHHDDGRPRADAAVSERQRTHRSRAAVGERAVAGRDVFGCVVRRAGGGDSRRSPGSSDRGAPRSRRRIFGLRRATSGDILIDGVPVEIDSPATAIDRGMAFLTEDRKMSGLFLPLSVHENMEVAVLGGEFVTSGFVKQAKLLAACRATAAAVRVKTPDLFEPVQNLSGGNQQKVLVGRWLLTSPRILILDEPTRGIDVGAKAEIHRLISTLAAEGAAVIMISSEMPEILGMSDRVMVMREGRVAGISRSLRRESGRSHEAGRPLRTRRLSSDAGIFLVLVGIAVLFEAVGWQVRGASFLFNGQRLLVMVLQVSIIGLLAIGVTQVILTGGIDLSSGSVVALSAMIAASLAQTPNARAVFPSLTDLPVIVPVAAGLATGAIAGLVNGSLIAYTGIPPFIATLGMMVSARGLARYYTRGQPVSMLTEDYTAIGEGAVPVVIFLVGRHLSRAAASHAIWQVHLCHRRERPGRARVRDSRERHLIVVYTVAGLLAGLGGVVTSARAASGQAGMGMSYELDAIAAAVIGGTSLSGGIGRIAGTVIGTIILGIMTSGFTFIGFDAYIQDIVKGGVIVSAVVADRYRHRGAKG